MKFLRTTSTNRLLATLAGLVAAIVAGGAIAVAASGPGPVPKRRSLPAALHLAASAKQVKGITARITFTNALIDASNLQGSDPLLQGASGRLWLGDHRLRLELQSSNGDAQIVVNGRSFWVSDPAQHVVYQGTLPVDPSKKSKRNSAAKADAVPTIANIQSELNKLAQHLSFSGAIPTDVAGQAAYRVRVSPRHDGGLLGAAQVAWDAARGVPLSVAVYAKGNPNPVLALKASDISYGKVPASDFSVMPPAGSKVVKVSTAGASHSARGQAKRARQASVTGVKAVASKLSFKLAAPGTLIALPRQSVKLLSWGDKPAALVTYGQGLGGIAVIEQSKPAGSKTTASTQTSGDGKAGFSLPTVSINGATGTELDTALGTVVQFTRNGVSYIVLGSVPPYAAEKAARTL